MKQEILIRFPWPWLTVIALLIFFSFFVVLVFRVSMKSRRHIFAAAETLPLQDGERYE